MVGIVLDLVTLISSGSKKLLLSFCLKDEFVSFVCFWFDHLPRGVSLLLDAFIIVIINTPIR